jgi:hypothetical protein
LGDHAGLPDDSEIADVVAKHGKGRAMRALRWVQVLDKAGGTTDSLLPLAQIDAEDGSTLYVNHRRELFATDVSGDLSVQTKAGPLKLRKLLR